jgi:hypothetical protein
MNKLIKHFAALVGTSLLLAACGSSLPDAEAVAKAFTQRKQKLWLPGKLEIRNLELTNLKCNSTSENQAACSFDVKGKYVSPAFSLFSATNKDFDLKGETLALVKAGDIWTASR